MFTRSGYSRIAVRLCAAIVCGCLPWAAGSAALAQSIALANSAGGLPDRPLFAGDAPREGTVVDADSLLVERWAVAGREGPLVLGSSDYPVAPSTDWWTWQMVPEGLIYHSYLAGPKEPRFSVVFFNELSDSNWALDATLGARVGLIRYGSTGGERPRGWQLDAEGAAFPRINIEEEWDVDATDFRYGFPLTYGEGAYQVKLAFYHLSAHMGDELATRIPGILASRINFTRDVIVLGGSVYATPELRLYGEVGYAFHNADGSEPWEFQFGAEWSSCQAPHMHGAPFLAVNVHLHQEVDFGGQLTAQTGWQWRSAVGRSLRTGVQFQTGKTNQYEFFTTSETQLGWGFWYDY
jgi:hypothetical protein